MNDAERFLEMIDGSYVDVVDSPRLYRDVVEASIKTAPRSTAEFRGQGRIVDIVAMSEVSRPPGTLAYESGEDGTVSVTFGATHCDRTLTIRVDPDGSVHVHALGSGIDEVDDPISGDVAEVVRNLFVLCFGESTVHTPWTVAYLVDPTVGPDFEV